MERPGGTYPEDGKPAVLGIAVGVVGIIGVSVNYPIYKKILESAKQKYSADILALAREIAQE